MNKRIFALLGMCAAIASLNAGLVFGAEDERGGMGPPPPPPNGPHKGEGFRPGGPGPGQGGGWGGPLNEERVDKILDVLRDADPDAAAKLENARKNNFNEFREQIGPHAMQWLQLAQLKNNEPELYKLKIEEYKLDRRVEKIVGEMKRDGKIDTTENKELQDILSKQFDLRQQIQEKDLQRMEKQVAELREKINRRKAHREEMIKERLKELTERKKDKDW